MHGRSRRQPSVSSQTDVGSEAKRAKSKLSSQGLKRESEEEIQPRVLFRAPKEDVQSRKSKKSAKNESRKSTNDKVLERLVDKSAKQNCRESKMMLSSSQIAQK